MPEPPLHIAYVTTGYPYVSHTFILNEVLALRARGVRVDTFAVRREPRDECRTAEECHAWETTYALRPPRPLDYLRAHLAGLTRGRYWSSLRRALRMAGPSPRDLVWHAAYFAQAVVLWDRCRRAGIRHIHAHFANVASDLALLAASVGGPGFSWSLTMHGPTEFYDVRAHRLADKVGDARFVACISDFARSQLMVLTAPEQWTKLEVVRCGVDLDRFVAPAPRSADAATRVTCVGRLVPAKGQHVLLAAVAALHAEGLEIELELIGDGPDRAALEAAASSLGIADRVAFRGALAPAEVDAALGDTDVFCLASFAEGLPIVLMEAMAKGIPVLATRIMGIPELVQDDVTGRLVAPGSAAELARVLGELMGDREQRARLAAAGRERVTREYDQHANVGALHDAFARVLHG